jgi:hypothetical protein
VNAGLSLFFRSIELTYVFSFCCVSLLVSFCVIGFGGGDCTIDLDGVNLDAPEWSSDINNVTGVLKLWFRELPDPLMTFGLQPGFIEAASMSSCRSLLKNSIPDLRSCGRDRKRQIETH